MSCSSSSNIAEGRARHSEAGFVCFLSIAQGAFDFALKYAQERETFGKPIINHQSVANYLADNVRGTADWMPFLAGRAGQSWWREVLTLVAGYLLQWPQQARRFLLRELGDL